MFNALARPGIEWVICADINWTRPRISDRADELCWRRTAAPRSSVGRNASWA